MLKLYLKIKVRNIDEDDITRGFVICNLESNPVSSCVEF
jgi:translation elongation factor EF-1alpha